MLTYQTLISQVKQHSKKLHQCLGAISNTMPSYDPTPTEDTRQITHLNFLEVEITENFYVSDVYPNIHHSTIARAWEQPRCPSCLTAATQRSRTPTQVDHVDVGELGGLSDRAGGWNTVSRRSALPCGLLPGPEWSHLQLLQSRSGPVAVCAEPASGPTLPG